MNSCMTSVWHYIGPGYHLSPDGADNGGLHELVHDHGVALGPGYHLSPDGADKGGIHELVHDHSVALGPGY